MFLSRIFGGVVFFAALHCTDGLIDGMRGATSVRDWRLDRGISRWLLSMMRVETSKQRKLSEALLGKAVEFHGHGGPFMVVGLRMGLTALNRLDAHGWFDLRCRVKLRWRRPTSCVIDGIQSSTGCTMGKRNIEVEEGEGIAAEFSKGDENLIIVLKQEVLEKVLGTLAEGREEQAKSLVAGLIEASDNDLFEFPH